MNGHGIGVAALPLGQRGGQTVTMILMQCECGWSKRFSDVTTADAITDAAAEHRADVR